MSGPMIPEITDCHEVQQKIQKFLTEYGIHPQKSMRVACEIVKIFIDSALSKEQYEEAFYKYLNEELFLDVKKGTLLYE